MSIFVRIAECGILRKPTLNRRLAERKVGTTEETDAIFLRQNFMVDFSPLAVGGNFAGSRVSGAHCINRGRGHCVNRLYAITSSAADKEGDQKGN